MKWQWWSEPSDLSNLCKGFEGNSNNGTTNQTPFLQIGLKINNFNFSYTFTILSSKSHIYLVILFDGDSKMVFVCEVTWNWFYVMGNILDCDFMGVFDDRNF